MEMTFTTSLHHRERPSKCRTIAGVFTKTLQGDGGSITVPLAQLSKRDVWMCAIKPI
jgi:hypothetical protein